jgi:hypothetical protein
MGTPTGRKPGNVMSDDVHMDGSPWPAESRDSGSSRTRVVATHSYAVTAAAGELLSGCRTGVLVRARATGSESRDGLGEDD